MATKKETFITCDVIAVWPKLDEVDVYKPKRGPEVRKFKTGFKAAPGQEDRFAKMVAMLQDYAKRMIPNVDEPTMPFKPELDKNKKETGLLICNATSGEKYKPPVFDAKNKRVPETVKIGGGSRLKLDLSLNNYEDKDGGGVNLYINGVQLLELVEKGFGSKFEEADGFSYDEDNHDEPKSGFGVEEKSKKTDSNPLAF